MYEELTPREKEVLVLMVDGLTNKEIAKELILSHLTVKTHVCNILGKLLADNRTQAVSTAFRKGLIT